MFQNTLIKTQLLSSLFCKNPLSFWYLLPKWIFTFDISSRLSIIFILLSLYLRISHFSIYSIFITISFVINSFLCTSLALIRLYLFIISSRNLLWDFLFSFHMSSLFIGICWLIHQFVSHWIWFYPHTAHSVPTAYLFFFIVLLLFILVSCFNF